jgi:hypothetical protein
VATDKRTLARQALISALAVRQQHGKTLIQPLCPFDLALALEIDLWFQALASLEGMYSSSPRPAIIVGTERPARRQTYTCAHEIGHHVFGHGTKVDEIKTEHDSNSPFEPDEFLAQSFAGFLLVPKLAFEHALTIRQIQLHSATAMDFYRISCFFGVGYTTLVRHLCFALRLIPSPQEQALTSLSLRKIRTRFGVPDPTKPLVVVDRQWTGIAADLEIGDTLLAPKDCDFEGLSLISSEMLPGGQKLYEAVARGHGRLYSTSCDWSCFVRVRPKNFTGRAIYRHFPEEPDDL